VTSIFMPVDVVVRAVSKCVSGSAEEWSHQMKSSSHDHPSATSSERAEFISPPHPMRIATTPPLYPQRRRAWDRLIEDIDQASASLMKHRAAVSRDGDDTSA
jgi:hypothetical protein